MLVNKYIYHDNLSHEYVCDDVYPISLKHCICDLDRTIQLPGFQYCFMHTSIILHSFKIMKMSVVIDRGAYYICKLSIVN